MCHGKFLKSTWFRIVYYAYDKSARRSSPVSSAHPGLPLLLRPAVGESVVTTWCSVVARRGRDGSGIPHFVRVPCRTLIFCPSDPGTSVRAPCPGRVVGNPGEWSFGDSPETRGFSQSSSPVSPVPGVFLSSSSLSSFFLTVSPPLRCLRPVCLNPSLPL